MMEGIFHESQDKCDEYVLLSFFEKSLRLEIESALDLGSLLRSNTAITRMMTAYTRRLSGREYLREVLAEKVKLVQEFDGCALDMEPLKVWGKKGKKKTNKKKKTVWPQQKKRQGPMVKNEDSFVPLD